MEYDGNALLQHTLQIRTVYCENIFFISFNNKPYFIYRLF
ncbi:hypothetical protein SAMN02745108_01792 [Fibrobacter intestinalis]|uniref:Uncharacterized protein n=1 Tax=Fibrobacter intestinalis TaxID=28122 RepID=A0A1T4P2U1_9BACT|nr:hypothetical protein BGW94_2380 [Fibrobacter sp. NR9]SJZ85742.1 hypothetical protein SAMN02745108_01792 [Fibrobacter intestinalis]